MTRWTALCTSSAAARFVDVLLRGAGQVMFQDHPGSGLLFLAGLAWGSIAGGAPHVLAGGVTALIAATLTAHWLRADPALLRSGRCGYNALLTGLALTYYLGPGLPILAYAAFGGVITAFAVLAPLNAERPTGVGENTYPFVATTWMLVLAHAGFAGLADPTSSSEPPLVTLDAAITDPFAPGAFLAGVLHSVSQVFFKADGLAALLLVAGLAVSSVAAAAYAVGGAFLAVTAAHLFGVESALITSGLQGFSPVLSAIAFGTVFQRPSAHSVAHAAFATVFTVVVHSAMRTVLTPLGLSPLSAPFDLAAVMLLRRRR